MNFPFSLLSEKSYVKVYEMFLFSFLDLVTLFILKTSLRLVVKVVNSKRLHTTDWSREEIVNICNLGLQNCWVKVFVTKLDPNLILISRIYGRRRAAPGPTGCPLTSTGVIWQKKKSTHTYTYIHITYILKFENLYLINVLSS